MSGPLIHDSASAFPLVDPFLYMISKQNTCIARASNTGGLPSSAHPATAGGVVCHSLEGVSQQIVAELLHGCILSPLWCECATGLSDLALEQSPDLLCWHLSAVSWCWPVCGYARTGASVRLAFSL